MSVLSRLIEAARKGYLEASRPHVIVHSVSAVSVLSCAQINTFFLNKKQQQHNYGPKFCWSNVKQKQRRPLDSIILPGTTLNELIADIKDFLEMENWYMSAGIPHRRGYLLYGPPGTGKSESSNFLSSHKSTFHLF